MANPMPCAIRAVANQRSLQTRNSNHTLCNYLFTTISNCPVELHRREPLASLSGFSSCSASVTRVSTSGSFRIFHRSGFLPTKRFRPRTVSSNSEHFLFLRKSTYLGSKLLAYNSSREILARKQGTRIHASLFLTLPHLL